MKRLTVDRDTLADDLLPLAKAQMRVEHDRDDDFITEQLKQAINAVERRCNINVNPAHYSLQSCELGPPFHDYAGGVRAQLPVNNVVEIVSLTPPGGTDMAADYEIEQSEYGGNAAAYLVGSPLHAGDWELVVDVGMDMATKLEPAVTAAILRIAAAYYEARETFAPVYVEDFVSEIFSVWRPSA